MGINVYVTLIWGIKVPVPVKVKTVTERRPIMGGYKNVTEKKPRFDQGYLDDLLEKLNIDPNDEDFYDYVIQGVEIPDTSYLLYRSEDTSSTHRMEEWFVIIKRIVIDTEINNTKLHKPPSSSTVRDFKQWVGDLGIEGEYGLYSVTEWK